MRVHVLGLCPGLWRLRSADGLEGCPARLAGRSERFSLKGTRDAGMELMINGGFEEARRPDGKVPGWGIILGTPDVNDLLIDPAQARPGGSGCLRLGRYGAGQALVLEERWIHHYATSLDGSGFCGVLVYWARNIGSRDQTVTAKVHLSESAPTGFRLQTTDSPIAADGNWKKIQVPILGIQAPIWIVWLNSSTDDGTIIVDDVSIDGTRASVFSATALLRRWFRLPG